MAALSFGVVVAACAAIGRGLPVYGHGLEPFAFASGAAVAALLFSITRWASKLRGGIRRRTAVWIGATVALLTISFVVGSTSVLVVDGSAKFDWSTEARVAATSEVIAADAVTLQGLDDLAATDIISGRARAGEFTDAIATATEITARWANTPVADLPVGDLGPAADRLVRSADAMTTALTKKQQLVSVDDARLELEVADARQRFYDNYIEIGPMLDAVADQYGIPFDPARLAADDATIEYNVEDQLQEPAPPGPATAPARPATENTLPAGDLPAVSGG